MKTILVVGLGNYGKEYDGTYHNMGFCVVDKLCDELGEMFTKKECKAITCHTILNGNKLILAKPLTYMNASGVAIRELVQKYKISHQDIYVFCDDIDLPVGKVRFRHSGSGGTHNGLRNIVENIGEDFNRIKIGIGRDPKFSNLADFVLSKIPNQTKDILEDSCDEAVKLLINELENNFANR